MEAVDRPGRLGYEVGGASGVGRPGGLGQDGVAQPGGAVDAGRVLGRGHQGPGRAPMHRHVESGDLGDGQGVAGGVVEAHVAADGGDPH